MKPLLRCVAPVHHAVSAVCNVRVGRALSVRSLNLPEYEEILRCSACVVYRPHKTLMQSLLESEGIYPIGLGSSVRTPLDACFRFQPVAT